MPRSVQPTGKELRLNCEFEGVHGPYVESTTDAQG
jgi:hypothetical protein